MKALIVLLALLIALPIATALNMLVVWIFWDLFLAEVAGVAPLSLQANAAISFVLLLVTMSIRQAAKK
jgi:hypothetical protein